MPGLARPVGLGRRASRGGVGEGGFGLGGGERREDPGQGLGRGDLALALARGGAISAFRSGATALRPGSADSPPQSGFARVLGLGVGAEPPRLRRGEAAASSTGGAIGSRSTRLGRIRPCGREGGASAAIGALGSASTSAGAPARRGDGEAAPASGGSADQALTSEFVDRRCRRTSTTNVWGGRFM